MPGYVGGTAFDIIYEAHPDYDYTLYVRNEERAKPIAEKFADVKFVYGDLDSVDVIEKAASEADVVVRMSNCQTKLLTGNLHDSQILQIQRTRLEQPKRSLRALPLVTRPRIQDTTFISQVQVS